VVHALAQLSSLSSLSLVKCTVTSSVAELGAALKQLSSLQELEIEGTAKDLGSDAARTFPAAAVNTCEDNHLRAMAPATVALKQLLGTIAHISKHAQLRSLRLFLTDVPPVEALAHAVDGKARDGYAPWVAHIAEATALTRLALGQGVLLGASNKWMSRLAPKLTRLQVRGYNLVQAATSHDHDAGWSCTLSNILYLSTSVHTYATAVVSIIPCGAVCMQSHAMICSGCWCVGTLF
jgi:hypothetical protein